MNYDRSKFFRLLTNMDSQKGRKGARQEEDWRKRQVQKFILAKEYASRASRTTRLAYMIKPENARKREDTRVAPQGLRDSRRWKFQKIPPPCIYVTRAVCLMRLAYRDFFPDLARFLSRFTGFHPF